MDLLIDDTREIFVDVIARNYDAAIHLLKIGIWNTVYLDHDLGDLIPPERTGYTILCWLEDHPEFLPKKIVIVSFNPVGRKRMEQVLKKLYK